MKAACPRMKNDAATKRFIGICTIPTFLLYAIFVIYPIFNMFGLSFVQWNGLLGEKKFYGLKNYEILFKDSQFWLSFKNTLILIVLVTIVTFVLALLFASMLAKGKLKGQSFFRVLFYIPNILSIVVISAIFYMFYSSDYGILGPIVNLFGKEYTGILGDPDKVIYAIAVAMIWQAIGYYMVMYIAGMDSIPDELYESKIVYRTEKFEDRVRTFCMNPNGIVVNENTNGIVTVNGHSYEDEEKQTANTNFALLVAKHFSEPFKDSNGYGESIARLSNMLGGGVIVQRFGDLIRGRRSTHNRIEDGFVIPTLSAEPGDLSLVLPKRILDGIIEMIYALDKIAPGTANDDTLLYGVEVKFYNMEVELNSRLETKYEGLYVIGDGSGVTHSLSHASASGVFVAREIAQR